ncbi:IS3 family transposase [Kocuria rhizophila]|nr:IS3 family transposase [Kocuria rhizophila]
MEIARLSFYAWLAAAPQRAARAAADAALAAGSGAARPAAGRQTAIRAPRITADLNEDAPADERVNHKRVARVMRQHGLAGTALRKRVKTTVPDQADGKFPTWSAETSPLGSRAAAYVGDITYLPIADGTNLYLASCIHWAGAVGWSMAGHMRTELVEDALRTARRAACTCAARSSTRTTVGLHLEVVRSSLRAARGDPSRRA